jgi:hypothetical protein
VLALIIQSQLVLGVQVVPVQQMVRIQHFQPLHQQVAAELGIHKRTDNQAVLVVVVVMICRVIRDRVELAQPIKVLLVVQTAVVTLTTAVVEAVQEPLETMVQRIKVAMVELVLLHRSPVHRSHTEVAAVVVHHQQSAQVVLAAVAMAAVVETARQTQVAAVAQELGTDQHSMEMADRAL